MTSDEDRAVELRREAQAFRRMAADRAPQRQGVTLLCVARYFEDHAGRIERLRKRGW
jgi:hypothetical protein